jgi:hypothetical protein
MPRKKVPQGDYTVGYGRPPEHSRFKPGQSGNPRGRPKGSRDFATILKVAMDQKVTALENGRPRKITKAEAMVTTNLNKAVKGDLRAFAAMLALVTRAGLLKREAEPEAQTTAPEDAASWRASCAAGCCRPPVQRRPEP